MNLVLYDKLKFSWKRKIAQIVLEHTIHEKMSSFIRTPVGFTSPNKTTYTDKQSESVPIINANDERVKQGIPQSFSVTTV